MELLAASHVSSSIGTGLEILGNLPLSCGERMEIHIDAICRLGNVMFTLRRELPHCFRRHAHPSRQQLQAEAFEEAIGVSFGREPR